VGGGEGVYGGDVDVDAGAGADEGGDVDEGGGDVQTFPWRLNLAF
jgi:hypothetical protein